MALASARPIMALAARFVGAVARLLGDTPVARWFVILTLPPLFGSLITEPAAMTIGALLLSTQFYALKPSERLKYATLALLFVNVSVGGALTNFAAPPVVMVAAKWGWSSADVFRQFGEAAIASILLSNVAYLLVFRKELMALRPSASTDEGSPASIPVWVTSVHLLLMVWTVAMLAGHHPILMVGGFLVFLAFTVATPQWQDQIRLRGPLWSVSSWRGWSCWGTQGWWISPVLVRLDEKALMAVSVFLTAFNDNAAITYLAAQVPALSASGPIADALRHSVLAGALAGVA